MCNALLPAHADYLVMLSESFEYYMLCTIMKANWGTAVETEQI